MTYEEFLEFDVIGAYSDFKSVRLAKDINYIPMEYEDIIPDKCLCGSDMIINDSDTILMCCDPRCYFKMGYSLDAFFKRFDCKGLGPETCISIVKYGVTQGIFVIPSFIEILYTYEKFEHIVGHRYYDLVNAVQKIQNTTLRFYELVQYIGIPGFDITCKDYFSHISNFDELMSELNKVSIVDFLRNYGVRDVKKALNLQFYLKDIRAFESLYRGKIMRPALKNVGVVITGPVSPKGVKMNRKQFINLCNELSVVNGVPMFSIFETGALESAPYFIADSPSNSRKYTAARNRELSNPGLKLIYSSEEFIEMIQDEVNKFQDKLVEGE